MKIEVALGLVVILHIILAMVPLLQPCIIIVIKICQQENFTVDLKMVTFACLPKMIQTILTGQNKVLQQEIQNIRQTLDLMLIVVAPKKV